MLENQHKMSHIFSTIKIKEYNVMVDGHNFFHQPIKDYVSPHKTVRELTSAKDMVIVYLITYIF